MFQLDKTNSIACHFLAELRDKTVQSDSLRFRRNLERIGEILAYEISKSLQYESGQTQTPLGSKETTALQRSPVLVTILRAGLPFHQGFLNMFDKAESAFVGASRSPENEAGEFEIITDYVASPNLDGKDIIIVDPMLATGRSAIAALELLAKFGKPSSVHFASVIASAEGVEFVARCNPNHKIWVGSIDSTLNHKAYIIPGLGDAGDLAYGPKLDIGNN